eukprot:TRINITY_DN4221_c0_g1_i1.p1 TRINITY_DN4221_c0_g1~~TRINITY_DN4221_c0_g1_i1.p1  ORF type:complete len:250 (+),score=70.63 TRINITY_DN4221_c0_g1_i1:25-750(+)
MSTGRRGKKSAIDLLQSRITNCFEAKNYYEAEQLYDTLASRIVASKSYTDGSHVAIFSEGISKFLELNQPAHAAKVAQLIIEVFQQSQIPESEAHVEAILEVANKFSADHNEEEGKFRDEFLLSAVGWSGKFGPNVFGAAAFHCELARSFWSKQDYANSNAHFLKSSSATSDSSIEHAQMLIEWSNAGYRSEADLFITRAVLQFLAMENIKGASQVYKSFMESFETLNTPLTNFCKLRKEA